MGVYGKGNVSGVEEVFAPSHASMEAENVRLLPIAWEAVADAPDETIEVGGWRVEAGEKHLRYGTIMVEITADGETRGMFAPYDASATDGRATLARGHVFILDETVREYDKTAKHGKMFDAGTAYRERLLVGGGGQPPWEEFERAMPDLRLI